MKDMTLKKLADELVRLRRKEQLVILTSILLYGKGHLEAELQSHPDVTFKEQVKESE